MERQRKEESDYWRYPWLHLAFKAIEMERLLHKHYINGVTLSQDFIPKKSCHGLGFLAPNRYEKDLSKKVLNIHFGEGAAKIFEVKVEGCKKIVDLARFETDAPTPGAKPVDFFYLQL